ncbi:MAG: hypothetical protein FJX74_21385 [Armatimonadetes bacterium]|nr:hypothetical protein [Armatimonadota bacterium]
MKRSYLRLIALLLLLSMLPWLSGCGGGGVIGFALTVQKMYGIWKLYQVFDDGNPSWIAAAVALWKFQSNARYIIEYFDGADNLIASETGTWDVQSGVLVLDVEDSSIYPALEGKSVRLSGHFEEETADTLSVTRRVGTGQVTVSQEQVYQRQPEP